jgi:hypothetical protein
MRFTIILFLLFCVSANLSFGCSCGGEGTVEEELRGSSAVFVGTVSDIEPRTPAVIEFFNVVVGKVREFFGGRGYDYQEGYGLRVAFDTEQVFKGAKQKRITVITGFGGGDCGVKFEINKKYLVYAYRTRELGYGKDGLGTSICTRTSIVDNAREDLILLQRTPAN